MKYHLVAIALSLLGLTYVRCANVGRVGVEVVTPTYAIVIDAGSGGTRVNLFTFHHSVDGQLVLDNSYFNGTTPGLSAYAKNPENVTKSLNTLLDKAKTKIPRSQWASTPMSLKATAGLRLLPENEARTILDECKRVFASSGFKVSDDSVAIMDGTDEGIFSWITINFLLGKFDDPENSVAALDLGGGSTQVTFLVAPDAISENVQHVSVLGKNISVFSKSFLGLGMRAAMEQILIRDFDNPRRKDFKDLEVTSDCVSPAVSKEKWEYAGKTYWVSGPKNNAVDGSIELDKCIGIIKSVVHSAIPHKLTSLKEHKIYAISYYYLGALTAGLIDEAGGIVTVNSFRKKASEVCENAKNEKTFECLYLLYIYVLLHDGFGLDETTNIALYAEINKHQLSWALGAAFELL